MTSGGEDQYESLLEDRSWRQSFTEEVGRLYANTKDIFAPSVSKKADFRQFSGDESEAPHPGTEGVSFEEALEKCPHLAQQYKQQGNGECDHGEQAAAPSRCPYQNSESQEWPMRAVLMFIAYNVVSIGVSMEVVKIGFVIAAYHIGMLRISEFVTLYLVTASMSSYKLLGLLLMMTIKGGPVFSLSEQYKITPRNLFYGLVISATTIVVTGLSMHWAFYMEYFKKETQSDYVLFSPLHHILIPIAAEFVYRGFLLKEMGRDLGTWFGVIGSSGWFCILQRGQGSIKFAAFVQGLLWSICTTVLHGDLVPTTMAHVLVYTLRAVYPALYHAFYPESV